MPYVLREIRADDIAGLGLNRSKDVSMICGLVVRDPEHAAVLGMLSRLDVSACEPHPI